MAWLDPIDDGEMVQQSVTNWTEAKVRANMWDQYCTKGSFHGRGEIVDKTKIVSMDETKGVDTIALAWHRSS